MNIILSSTRHTFAERSDDVSDHSGNNMAAETGAGAKTRTEVVLMIDRSGSMKSIGSKVVVSAINEFLTKAKADTSLCERTFVTLIFFDDKVFEVSRLVSIGAFADVEERDYVPNGYTSLYDALVRVVGDRTLGMKRRKTDGSGAGSADVDHVLYVVFTDGEDTSSTASRDEAKRVLAEAESCGSSFVFLASGPAAFKELNYSLGRSNVFGLADRSGYDVRNMVPLAAGIALRQISDTGSLNPLTLTRDVTEQSQDAERMEEISAEVIVSHQPIS